DRRCWQTSIRWRQGKMMQLLWKSEYSVGIDEVDVQHRTLFEIFNEIHALRQDKTVVDKYDGIITILVRLSNYAEVHFHTEEEIMAGCNYPQLAEHRQKHQDFMEKVNNIDPDKIDMQQDRYLREIMDFVGNWLCDHILVMDKEMGGFCAAVRQQQQ
ncbi:MAG: hemerythrin family protein, partial [Negativicutes bacterium]|nr:hemerythrin family protein [Negativicutes bacterium]